MSASEKPTFLISGPFPIDRPGYDGESWAWYLGGKRLEVRFSSTALAVGEEGLSDRAAEALRTKGESEAPEFLRWKEIPDYVEFTTDNWPWIEGGELD